MDQRPTENLYFVAVTENGYGIKFKRADVPMRKSVIGMLTTERNGKVVSVVPCKDGDKLLVATDLGGLICMESAHIRESRRGGHGVRLFDIYGTGRVVSVSVESSWPDTPPEKLQPNTSNELN